MSSDLLSFVKKLFVIGQLEGVLEDSGDSLCLGFTRLISNSCSVDAFPVICFWSCALP